MQICNSSVFWDEYIVLHKTRTSQNSWFHIVSCVCRIIICRKETSWKVIQHNTITSNNVGSVACPWRANHSTRFVKSQTFVLDNGGINVVLRALQRQDKAFLPQQRSVSAEEVQKVSEAWHFKWMRRTREAKEKHIITKERGIMNTDLWPGVHISVVLNFDPSVRSEHKDTWLSVDVY